MAFGALVPLLLAIERVNVRGAAALGAASGLTFLPVFGSVEETTARLVQYVQTLYPVLGQYLPSEAVDE